MHSFLMQIFFIDKVNLINYNKVKKINLLKGATLWRIY